MKGAMKLTDVPRMLCKRSQAFLKLPFVFTGVGDGISWVKQFGFGPNITLGESYSENEGGALAVSINFKTRGKP